MSFKQLLNEEQEILQEFAAHNVIELIAAGSVPLEAGMMDRLGFLERDQIAYHMTNAHYLDDMVKNQNKKIQISCFTKGSPELLRLPSVPNTLLKMEGTTVIKGKTDIWSLPSVRGRRWLQVTSIGYTGEREKRAEKLEFLLAGVLQRVTNTYNKDFDMYNASEPQRIEIINKLTDKEKVSFYRLYLKETEKMLNKHYRVLIDYVNGAASFGYNEVILTKWKILEIKAIETDSNQSQIAGKLKLPYAGVITKKEIAKIRK